MWDVWAFGLGLSAEGSRRGSRNTEIESEWERRSYKLTLEGGAGGYSDVAGEEFNHKGGGTQRESTMEDGFTAVRPNGRRAYGMGRKVGKQAAGSGVVTHKETLMRLRSAEKVTVSNSFGSLGEGMVSSEVNDGGVISEANKENEDTSNQLRTRRSNVLGNGMVFRGSMGMSKAGGRGGTNDRSTMSCKVLEEKNVRHITVKQSKPTRGLVFGPVRGELELSANGKRLRVEKESLGRSGGAFSTSEEGARGLEVLTHNEGVDVGN